MWVERGVNVDTKLFHTLLLNNSSIVGHRGAGTLAAQAFGRHWHWALALEQACRRRGHFKI